MKLTCQGHSAFRIEADEADEADEANILIDPIPSNNRSSDKGWSGYLTDKNSTQGGDR